MNLFLLEGAAPAAQPTSMITVIAIYAVFGLAIYFFLFRPQSKKKKQDAKMRSNAQVGDMITTIGGISGRIVSVREDSDSIILETGSDRTKMLIKRWAIGTVDTIKDGE